MSINSTVSSVFVEYESQGFQYDHEIVSCREVSHILFKDGLELGRVNVTSTSYITSPTHIESEERAALWEQIQSWTTKRIAQEQFMEQELKRLKGE